LNLTREFLMLRKWIAPMASLALLASLGTASMVRAADAPTTMPAGKATISIKVVDGDGKAVAGATVDLMPPPTKKAKGATPTAAGPAGATAQPMAADPTTPTDPTPPKKVRAKPLQTTTTDADGTASFKGVADGTYTVRARLKGTGNGMEKVTVADDKDVTVTVTVKPRA
jgi:hypothetical protein